MENFELQLPSRIIREGKSALQTALDFGITLDDFRTSEGKGMWAHLLAYFYSDTAAGSVPGVNAASLLFPNFRLCDDAGMSTAKLCEEVRRQRLVLDLRAAATYLNQSCEQDPLRVMAETQNRLTQLIALSTSRNTDVAYERVIDDIFQAYEEREAGIHRHAKMPWPWPHLQEETNGLQESDFVVFYGRPKNKKSWILSYLIAHAYLSQKNVLVYTKEMTPINLFERISACIAKVPYSEFRKGGLSAEEKANLRSLTEFVKVLKDQQNFTILSGGDVPDSGDTIPWLASKIDTYKPDVVFVDGLYLMSDINAKKNQTDEMRVRNISRAFRQLVLNTKIPAIVTAQANRKAAGHKRAELDEIAHSDALAQDATLAMRVIAERTSPTVALVVGGAREFNLHGIRIHGVPAINFEETSDPLMTEKDISNAKTFDTSDEEPNAAGAARPRRQAKLAQQKEQEELLRKQLDNLALLR